MWTFHFAALFSHIKITAFILCLSVHNLTTTPLQTRVYFYYTIFNPLHNWASQFPCCLTGEHTTKTTYVYSISRFCASQIMHVIFNYFHSMHLSGRHTNRIIYTSRGMCVNVWSLLDGWMMCTSSHKITLVLFYIERAFALTFVNEKHIIMGASSSLTDLSSDDGSTPHIHR